MEQQYKRIYYLDLMKSIAIISVVLSWCIAADNNDRNNEVL